MTVPEKEDSSLTAEPVAAKLVEITQAETRHTEIQGELLQLGADMGFDVWVARNDRGRLWNGVPLHQKPLAERRAFLEQNVKGFELSEITRDIEKAKMWLERLEVLGLDGIVAKRADLPYMPGSRDAVQKVKHHRTIDCVIVGYRTSGKKIASLLLGLYRNDGTLDMNGVARTFDVTKGPAAGTDLDVAVPITGPALDKTGNGRLQLDADNSVTLPGVITVDGGTVVVSASGKINDAVVIAIIIGNDVTRKLRLMRGAA